MRKEVKIPLPKPISDHHELVKEVVLREPTYSDYLELGDPYVVTRSVDGLPFIVDNLEIIGRYIDRCLVSPSSALLLNQADFRVARQVKDAVLGFFRNDPAEGEGSTTSPTN